MPLPLVVPKAPRGDRPAAVVQTRPGTVVDVLHGRVLAQHLDGLFAYAALRLGDLDATQNAVAELRAIAAATEPDELVRTPGVKPRLFRLIRRIALRKRPGGAPPPSRAILALPFAQGGPALDAIRLLDDGTAELLELRHARGLSPEDVAFVVDRDVDDVLLELDDATNTARHRLAEDDLGAGMPLSDALARAFALDLAARVAVEAPVPAEEGLRPGSVLGGRYAIAARVGTGAFGDVYRANDTEVPGHVVGLKLLHRPALSDAARAAALRELHLIAAVFHPSIVQFKDYGWFEDRLWFVMPWYEGETLEARIARRPLDRQEARRVFEPLARALAVMHAAGIRHQDIKPDNIFLAKIEGFGQGAGEEEILPVLLDLGVAAKDAEVLIAGTPTYFAPEVAAQFAKIDARPRVTPRADVFSLALALRNALEPSTQDVVETGATDAFITERAVTSPRLPTKKELRYLAPHFARWLHRDPNERPTADELANELSVLTEPEERKKRRATLLRWLVPLTVVVGVVFAAGFLLLNERAERERLEAFRARAMAEGLRESLDSTRGKARALEENLKELERGYERSTLSRRQLAAELAAHRAQSEALTQEIGRTKRALSATQAEAVANEARLASAENSLKSEKERAARAERDLQRELATLRRERGELEVEAANHRARYAAEAARSERLMREVAEANAAKVRAESALAALRTAHRTRSDAEVPEEDAAPEDLPSNVD